jgi:sec-independent protein translocase protein TatC
MKRKMTAKKHRQNHPKAQSAKPRPEAKQPFIQHLYELRGRLFKVAFSVIIFSSVGYGVEQKLVGFLLKPAHGQQFIYTSPLGGLNFLFQVCIYFGFVLSIPVVIYQLLRYLEPLIQETTRHLVIVYTFISGALALAGGAFGYFFGLPLALRFLTHQFTTTQIKPLLTIQDYMSFVTIYLLGSALLFQLPLIMTFTNRIKPLKPGGLLKFERYMVLISFVAAAIMTPTTDIFDQLLFAAPIMAMYQIGIVLIYLKNRKTKRNPQLEALPPLSDKQPVLEPPVAYRPPVMAQAMPLRPQAQALSKPVRKITVSYRSTPRPKSAWDIVVDQRLRPHVS